MAELVVGENRTLPHRDDMTFEEFQHLARLSVVGALDPDEVEQFEAGRRFFGKAAEAFIQECQSLNEVFALSLQPCPPDPRTKERLFERIRAAMPREQKGDSSNSSGLKLTRPAPVAQAIARR